MTVLVVAEHDHRSIKKETLQCVMAAAQITLFLDGEVHIMMMGQPSNSALLEASDIPGVTKIIHGGDVPMTHGLAENMAHKIQCIASRYSHILCPDTASGKYLAFHVAAKLDLVPIPDIRKVLSADSFESSADAGRAVTVVSGSDDVMVMTVSTKCFDAVPATGGSAAIESVDDLATPVNSTHWYSKSSKNKRPHLTDAKITVRDGHALNSSEKFSETSL